MRNFILHDLKQETIMWLYIINVASFGASSTAFGPPYTLGAHGKVPQLTPCWQH